MSIFALFAYNCTALSCTQRQYFDLVSRSSNNLGLCPYGHLALAGAGPGIIVVDDLIVGPNTNTRIPQAVQLLARLTSIVGILHLHNQLAHAIVRSENGHVNSIAGAFGYIDSKGNGFIAGFVGTDPPKFLKVGRLDIRIVCKSRRFVHGLKLLAKGEEAIGIANVNKI